jgi:hypothetical protein
VVCLLEAVAQLARLEEMVAGLGLVLLNRHPSLLEVGVAVASMLRVPCCPLVALKERQERMNKPPLAVRAGDKRAPSLLLTTPQPLQDRHSLQSTVVLVVAPISELPSPAMDILLHSSHTPTASSSSDHTPYSQQAMVAEVANQQASSHILVPLTQSNHDGRLRFSMATQTTYSPTLSYKFIQRPQ